MKIGKRRKVTKHTLKENSRVQRTKTRTPTDGMRIPTHPSPSHTHTCTLACPSKPTHPPTCQPTPALYLPPAPNSPSPLQPADHLIIIAPSSMADRQPGGPLTRETRPGTAPYSDGGGPSLLRRLREHAPNSTQVLGFLTLLVSGAILLVLTGLTVTGAVAGLVFFAPIILISSPVWVPAAALLFIGVTGFLSACGFGVAVLAGATWMYRYFMGRHPVGSGGVDYARSRIADRAREVKDYAREHGIYFPGRIKDAAPGA